MEVKDSSGSLPRRRKTTPNKESSRKWIRELT